MARAPVRRERDGPVATIALARRCLSAIETMPVLEGYAFESGIARELAGTEGARAPMRAFASRRTGAG